MNNNLDNNELTQRYILSVFYEAIGEQFEMVINFSKEVDDLENFSKLDDYKGKKYIVKESFKQVKLIFLHKYGVVI